MKNESVNPKVDNGSAGGREMKAAETEINNRRANSLWPLMVIGSLLFVLVFTIFTSIKKIISNFFKQKKSVKGKVILITGAGRGLGRSMALELSKLGARVACVDINVKNNEETAELIRKEGGTAQAFVCNIAKSKHVEQLKNEVQSKMGPVDILVNNAALVMAIKVKDISYEDIRGMYEVNLMGHAFMAKAFLPDMMERNSGHIVTISSVSAMVSSPFLTLYSSTKSGITRFFECVRVELDMNKNNQVKITNIHPFFINTSADYTSWFDSFFPILNEKYVSRSAVDAILYEQEFVSVPRFFNLLALADALTGSHQYNSLMTIIGNKYNIPTAKERSEMPYTSIVKDITSAAK